MNKKLTNILRTNVTLYFICLVLFALAAIPFDVRLAIGEGAAAVVLLPELVPYAMGRLSSWRDPFADPLGDGHQTIQSLYAIGSGGAAGVGAVRRAGASRRPGRWGRGMACLMERLIFPSGVMASIFTVTSWPSARKSCTSLTKVGATSEICTKPLFPSGRAMNAPNFVMVVTFPVTIFPTAKSINVCFFSFSPVSPLSGLHHKKCARRPRPGPTDPWPSP